MSGEARAGVVAVVDDDPTVRRVVVRALEQLGLSVRQFESATDAWAEFEAAADEPDLILTDVMMPGLSGFELLSRVHARWPEVPVLLMTAGATVAAAVDAIRSGAYDYLVKPLDVQNTLIPDVRRALEHRRLLERNRFLEGQLTSVQRARGMVGGSAAMRQVAALVSAVAPSDVTVLVLGESGTGKELVARAVHDQSPRSGRPFVDVNCAALTESLLESELFGHVKGAFTGALTARRGLFETASGGTLFMDEVGELSPTTQARLLRVLQEGTVRPVGSNESRQVDVRVIAATNKDLEKAVKSGQFRQDLYYRLAVFTIELPPLRERRGDIPALVAHFVAKHTRSGRTPPELDAAALDLLTAGAWPGNIRELENTMARALVLCSGGRIGPEHLPASLSKPPPAADPAGDDLGELAEARDQFTRSYVARVMARVGGDVAEAAKRAGMNPSNFRRLLKRLEENLPAED